MGRIIEIDIHDGIFSGNADNFTWKWDSETFIAYIVDSLYHIHHGIMVKQDNGMVVLYDSKNNKYLDNDINRSFMKSINEATELLDIDMSAIEKVEK